MTHKIAETIALPPDVANAFPAARYTAEEWLAILRQQFTPATWERAIAGENRACAMKWKSEMLDGG